MEGEREREEERETRWKMKRVHREGVSEGVKRPTEIVGSSESQRRDGFAGGGSKRR